MNIACPTGNFYLFSLFPDLFHLISRTGPHTDETKIANEYVMPEAVMVGSRGAGVGSKTAAVEPAEKKNTKMKEKVSEREIEYIIRRPLAILTGVEAVVLWSSFFRGSLAELLVGPGALLEQPRPAVV